MAMTKRQSGMEDARSMLRGMSGWANSTVRFLEDGGAAQKWVDRAKQLQADIEKLRDDLDAQLGSEIGG